MKKMKYCEMVKFLNDNGILLLQPVIADTVDTLLPKGKHHMSIRGHFHDVVDLLEK